MVDLIVVADDFGYSDERNRGILECFREKLITHSSLLVNGYSIGDWIERANQEGLPLGLHLNLTEGEPLSKPTQISSLVDKSTGNFLSKTVFWQKICEDPFQFAALHVEREVIAQIEEFKNLTGYFPSYIDGHNHCHTASKSIVSGLISACRRYPSIKRCRLPLQISPSDNDMHNVFSISAMESKAETRVPVNNNRIMILTIDFRVLAGLIGKLQCSLFGSIV